MQNVLSKAVYRCVSDGLASKAAHKSMMREVILGYMHSQTERDTLCGHKMGTLWGQTAAASYAINATVGSGFNVEYYLGQPTQEALQDLY